jgi:hypothetical protein
MLVACLMLGVEYLLGYGFSGMPTKRPTDQRGGCDEVHLQRTFES